ncbi:MAG: DNA-directed RNA polymerase specialized sigma24 family protein [Verrucomicrobiales bacterium]|jgi:DNA-directed RNA polymerase specialized sigma24 family protein
MPANFQPTRWSLIHQAAATNERQRDAAWSEFDGLYRAPLLGHIRRSGWGADDADDLLQNFFAKLSERDWLSVADPELGKMRTFLLSKLKGHLSDARKHRAAQKRGGDVKFARLETGAGPIEDPAAAETGDAAFDRDWAWSILSRALGTLRSEAEAKGQGKVFELLRSQLTGDDETRLRDAAATLGESAGAVRTQLYRLRERFRILLRAEVAETLLPEENVSEELRYLARILE